MRRLSLRMRLLLAGAGAIFLSLALAALALSNLFAAHVERRAVAELGVHLDQLLAGIERGTDGALEVAAGPAEPRFQRPLGGLYWQIEAEGAVLRSRSLWDYTLPMPVDVLDDRAGHTHHLAGASGEPLLVFERLVRLPARLGGVAARAAVAMAADELAAAKRAFMADLAPYMVLLAVALIAAGWVQVGVGLSPLAAVKARVAAVRSGALARLGADFPTELQPLAGEVDALLAEREAELARARTRAGDLAHGLKTPLQALLGEAERLRRAKQPESARAIEEITTEMHRAIDRELSRARIAARAASARADVAEAAARILRVIRRSGRGAALEWIFDVPPGLNAAVDIDDLTEALGALTENAARHAKATVRLTATRQREQVLIEVCDDGPGIPADKIEALVPRGARADESAAGAGLGLAIAREIAEAAGGGLTLSDAAPGLRAALLLPAAAI
ncbi:sensor histidine kinase [Phaeovulum sp.]|uniref:sensor histidine kinase n=1 Tax=Phaeovulum sp. TaxID=2934796 RepID=UPI0027305FCE|nr:HAMP domain-containing sensor histidine kinase [Phaeovulum sp.]MDP1669742.1 HAMP domain-containing sensor histidine kinase [Phaeovulum sp.]MDP2063248.1 HAMP domain-containing sensor histidine kinase [Phaeovulum sp.]MDP3862735.1 HAMP domain-containing sensor histidine kinase [Phaeovulum sp.]MDZ4119030.1 HAMP domain-containing sensor histidine kinase [Phaeovulum sp.]